MKEDLYFHGVKALIKNSQGEYLLLRVNTSSWYEYKGGDYRDIPGGRVEFGMNIPSTLLREIMEEISIQNVVIGGCLGTSLSNIRIKLPEGNFGLFLSIYECGIPENSQIILSDEHVEYKRFPREQAKILLGIKYNEDFLNSLNI